MIEAIRDFFVNFVGEEFAVLICSMLPVIELRGGIPIGMTFGLPWWENYLLCVLGNMIPVPFILLFIQKILEWFEKGKIGFLRKFALWLRRKADKNQEKIARYGFWGVCLFVAIPLPATGAWTGSLVASTIHLDFWRAMLSALIGVMIAGTIVSLIAYGALGIFSWLL